jgi:hypothetical protein
VTHVALANDAVGFARVPGPESIQRVGLAGGPGSGLVGIGLNWREGAALLLDDCTSGIDRRPADEFVRQPRIQP